MEVSPGDTFLLGGFQLTDHLWVVVCGPADDPPSVVIVSCTTRRDWSDTTVVLDQGDHPFLSHETVIMYSDARIIPVRNIEMQFERRMIVIQPPMDEGVLRRIQEGVQVSPEATPKIKSFCR